MGEWGGVLLGELLALSMHDILFSGRARGSLHTPSRNRFASSRSRITQSRHGCQDVAPLSYDTNEPRAEFSKQMPKYEDVVWKSSPPQNCCFEPVLKSLKRIWGNWSYSRASTPRATSFAPSATWPWPGAAAAAAAARPWERPVTGNAIPLNGNAIPLNGNTGMGGGGVWRSLRMALAIPLTLGSC